MTTLGLLRKVRWQTRYKTEESRKRLPRRKRSCVIYTGQNHLQKKNLMAIKIQTVHRVDHTGFYEVLGPSKLQVTPDGILKSHNAHRWRTAIDMLLSTSATPTPTTLHLWVFLEINRESDSDRRQITDERSNFHSAHKMYAFIHVAWIYHWGDCMVNS